MAASNTKDINPARAAFPITPNNAGNFQPTRALYIGSEGNVRVTMFNGGVVTFAGMTAGSIYPISVIRVWATGTTASEIIGLT